MKTEVNKINSNQNYECGNIIPIGSYPLWEGDAAKGNYSFLMNMLT